MCGSVLDINRLPFFGSSASATSAATGVTAALAAGIAANFMLPALLKTQRNTSVV